MYEPARYDLKIYIGVSFNINFTWKHRNGDVYDLSSFTAELQIRETVHSPTALVTLTTENGGIIVDSVSPNLKLILTSDQTTALSEVNGHYDLKLTSEDQTVMLILKGKATIILPVTR